MCVCVGACVCECVCVLGGKVICACVSRGVHRECVSV